MPLEVVERDLVAHGRRHRVPVAGEAEVAAAVHGAQEVGEAVVELHGGG